jgi:cysteine desulfurase
MKRNIYMDYAASTPVDPRVIKRMLPYFNKFHGNPSSLHDAGTRNQQALEESRQTLAAMLGAKAREIVFTGSATESNNLALKGAAFANRASRRHLLVSAIEHDCVLESAAWLGR